MQNKKFEFLYLNKQKKNIFPLLEFPRIFITLMYCSLFILLAWKAYVIIIVKKMKEIYNTV